MTKAQREAERAKKQEEALKKEKERMFELFSYEREYANYQLICGIDEAGRGPWVGPVVAGAVILPKDCLRAEWRFTVSTSEPMFTAWS